MSSLTTCSGQGVVIQGKGNKKECVVEDIGNKSSHTGRGQPFPTLTGQRSTLPPTTVLTATFNTKGNLIGAV